jgi:hypothetical protein
LALRSCARLGGDLRDRAALVWRRGRSATDGPRGAAILFAIAIPLGLAIDLLPQLLVPIPLFFTGAGVYVGLGLLALSIARLGTAARRPRVTGDADGGGGLWGPKRQRGEPPVVAARTQLSPAGRNARASHGRS